MVWESTHDGFGVNVQEDISYTLGKSLADAASKTLDFFNFENLNFRMALLDVNLGILKF